MCEATSYSHRGKPPTTIGAKELNFRVRYGNGCDLFAIITSLVYGCHGVYVATGRGVLSRRSLEHHVFERIILSKLDKRFIVHSQSLVKSSTD